MFGFTQIDFALVVSNTFSNPIYKRTGFVLVAAWLQVYNNGLWVTLSMATTCSGALSLDTKFSGLCIRLQQYVWYVLVCSDVAPLIGGRCGSPPRRAMWLFGRSRGTC
ncbi:hypothetical protein FKM82_025427 [Ascaphus truei]